LIAIFDYYIAFFNLLFCINKIVLDNIILNFADKFNFDIFYAYL